MEASMETSVEASTTSAEIGPVPSFLESFHGSSFYGNFREKLYRYFHGSFHWPREYKKAENVSCDHDRWVIETQLHKLRDTSDTLIERTCAIFHL